MSIRNLEALFQPASVALVGASDREGSLGRVLLRNLKQGGFRGPVWPVNRRHSRIDGGQAWPDVSSLPGVPDLAVICTPPATVPDLIAELGRKGTRAAIVITAGLKQAAAQGGTLEQAMLDAARGHLLRVLGPNCIGALVPGIGLNASFAPGNALPGRLAFVTQSGALATAMLDWARGQGIGFSHFISLGDSADVDFGDVLDYLGSDPGTRAILMYMESVQAARKFMSAARAAARNKPVILVKAGRAPEGAKAAASHTGALAGSDVVFDAAVRRAGMLRVDTLEALFDAAQTLAHARPWRGEALAILTNGGGAGVLAADALSLAGGKLAALAPETVLALDACLPATWSRGNPVDIIGDAPVQRYVDALRVLLAAPEVDALLFMHAPTAIVPAADISAACLPLLQASAKPVLTSWLGGPAVAAAASACAAAGFAVHSTPERSAAAWMQVVDHARNQQTLQQIPEALLPQVRPDRAAAQALWEEAGAAGRAWLGDAASQALLRAYGIPVVATQRVGDDPDAACAAADAIGYPVALKIVSPQVIHKSDVGGVVLGLASAQEVRAACAAMRERVRAKLPQAQLEGFTVQAMAQRRGALELIVGISSDPVFGPVLLLGEGGTQVEIRQNHAVALPPLNAALADDLVQRSGLSPLLAGHRGRPAADAAALQSALLKVSQLACDLPWVRELDINPLLVDEHGVLAVDSRVRLRVVEPGEDRLAIRPYPAELEERVLLGASELLLRPIRPEDGLRLLDFYADASPHDLRLRFFMARREVPRSELARYSQIDYDREMTFVALAPADASGSQAMAGEVRAVCDPDNERAEFAIQVARDWQGRGLGRILMDKLLRYLRSRGTAEVVGECLLENTAMAALAREMGFEVAAGSGDGLALRLPLR
jgi:acetyltransferase